MGLTPYPHGILATPNLGAGLGFGWKTDAKAVFVDGLRGSDSNDGSDPENAKSTIQGALSVAMAYDVIYVMDPGTTASDPNTYTGSTANWTVGVTRKGLALVGVAHSAVMGNGRPVAPSLYAYAAATPTLKVNAPLVAIENFRIAGAYAISGSETAGIAVADFSEGVYEGFGLSVNNCYFEDINSVGDLGAIAVTGQWNPTITNCSFMNCEMGISIVSSGSTVVGTIIDGVKFMSRTGLGTVVKCDIYVYCQGESGLLISNVLCGHDVPLATGGKGACIAFAGGAETGLVSNVCFMDANATAHATTGPGFRGPVTVGINRLYNGADGLLTI